MIPGPSATQPVPGTVEALRAIGKTLVEGLRLRSSLFSLELAQEIRTRRRMFLLGALAAVLLYTAFLLMTALVLSVFWNSYRDQSIAALALLYLAAGVAAILRYRAVRAAAPAPFSVSLQELRRDLADTGPQE